MESTTVNKEPDLVFRKHLYFGAELYFEHKDYQDGDMTVIFFE